ncbi:multidrug ABC transporter ATP-binding protein [Thermoanaerobacterium thermosaccharolyticum]|uniref:Multidrug ABC transporter ATP-binding protein n=1 Tax=Thermoanaerobacterium thermosaccharolyticum TaxID=1517 RepID=A0A223HV52_THETR|nr:ATP-binding cassette domain-containing protein [Thermoanaerobacterium thermosaccharolyticum]AST56340.1 multidrug ABC transporter ATP-binding protein [Thermoanaerobacterium thermosaccharolyticum]
MNFSIEIKNLKKKFKDFEAVGGITFNVEKGEVFGLLGPNGAGKTTTIRMITTLMPPTSGEIFVAGYDAKKYGATIRKYIGYVPQALSADSTLTGYENLLFVAKLLRLSKKEREERIDYILNILNLKDAENRLIKEYSGGMIRRLEIGQAIIHRPEVLILDEPTVGLDPVARLNVWKVLETLRKETGLTILITTHYMEEAEAICGRIAIMNSGKIAAMGTPEELKLKTGNPDATLEDVFTFFTKNQLESGGSYRETSQLRKRIQRFS